MGTEEQQRQTTSPGTPAPAFRACLMCRGTGLMRVFSAQRGEPEPCRCVVCNGSGRVPLD